MSMPRRRIIRPAPETVSIDLQRQRQLEKLHSRLRDEHNSLARWQTRLKRAFTTVAKHMKRIVRIERNIAKLEE